MRAVLIRVTGTRFTMSALVAGACLLPPLGDPYPEKLRREGPSGGGEASDKVRVLTCEREIQYLEPAGLSFEDALARARDVPPVLLPMDPDDAAKLDAVFEAELLAHPDDATAAVLLDDGRHWVYGSERFWWASAGKPFVAMRIMSLVEAGTLSLSSPIDEFSIRIPHASIITVRHLMTHSSGIPNFMKWEPEYHDPTNLVAGAFYAGRIRCPGERFNYSNTGFLLLGLILETAAQRRFHEDMNDFLADRLGPTSLRALAPGEFPADVVEPENGPVPNLTTPFSAAALVGTALDMAIAWKWFVSGRMVSSAAVREMVEAAHQRARNVFYGMGVGIRLNPTSFGHNGAAKGISTYVGWSDRRQAVISVALVGEGDARAVAAALLDALPP